MKKKKLQTRKNRRITFIFFYSLLFFMLGFTAIIISSLSDRQTQITRATGGDCTVTTAQLQITAKEQELFNLINDYRASKNLPRLLWDPTLNKAASWQSADMLKNNRMNHLDSLNRNPEQRFPDCGYAYSLLGENIGSGDQIAVDIFNAWKVSPPHNDNMLKNNFTIGAVSLESDSSNMYNYWTFVFGTNVLSLSPTPSTQPSASPFPTVRLTNAPTSVQNTPTLYPPITQTPTTIIEPTQIADLTPTNAPITPNMQIRVKVKIQGIGVGGNFYPKHLTRKVHALIMGSEETPVTEGSAYLTYDNNQYFTGVINLGRMQEGLYFVKLMSYGTLFTIAQPEFQHLKINTVNEIPAVSLVQGDVNGDNVISITDYNLALACFQDKRCPLPEVIDLNDDSRTDVTDYNLLLQSFMQQKGQ